MEELRNTARERAKKKVIENVSEHNANIFKDAKKKDPRPSCPFLREYGWSLFLCVLTMASIIWVLISSWDLMGETKDLHYAIGKFEDYDEE